MKDIKIGKKLFCFYLRDYVFEKKILGLLRKIPLSHLQGLRAIFQPIFMENPDGRGKRDNAFYHSKKNAISLGLKTVRFPSFEYRLFHEIGHHFFRKIIPKLLRNQWINSMTELRKDENLSHKLLFHLSNDEEIFASYYGYKYTNDSIYNKLPKQLKIVMESL